MGEVFTPATLAEVWGCSESHVRNLIASGQLQGFRLGAKLLRITQAAVEDFQCRQALASPSTEGSGASNTTPKTEAEDAIRSARLTGASLKLVSGRGSQQSADPTQAPSARSGVPTLPRTGARP